MGFQVLADGLAEASRLQRSEIQVTLGELIDHLRTLGERSTVSFSTGGGPTKPHSYRGYYSDLAFEPSGENVQAAKLLEDCVSILGSYFEGYKGGMFLMDEDTPVWCATYGDTGRPVVYLDNGILMVK